MSACAKQSQGGGEPLPRIVLSELKRSGLGLFDGLEKRAVVSHDSDFLGFGALLWRHGSCVGFCFVLLDLLKLRSTEGCVSMTA
jgi:hypothetical protein